MKKFRVIFFLVFLLIAHSSDGQDATGHLSGRVLNQQGQAVPAVKVQVEGPALQGVRTTSCTDKGHFYLYSLPVGIYTLTLQHDAFQDVRLTEIKVNLGRTNMAGEIRLVDLAHQMEEMVIYGEPWISDMTSASTGLNLLLADYAVLPVPRDFRSIISMQSQANESFHGDEVNIGGATGLENSYFIDGVNVTDPHRGAGSTSMPYNFIKEIQLKNGGYEAEYGKASGGIVNVVTHSGGNGFTGNAFGFLTTSGLTGEARRGLGATKVEQSSTYDAGLSLGGAIVRDRLWFFGAYNLSRDNRDVDISELGLQPLERTGHMFAGKLTWRASDNTDVIFTASGDPMTEEVLEPTIRAYGAPTRIESVDPVFGYRKMGGTNISVQGRHFLGANAIFEASVAQFTRQEDLHGATVQGRTEPLFIDQRSGSTQGTWSGGYGDARDFDLSRFAARMHGTIFFKQHVLKAGIEYENNGMQRKWEITGPGVIRQTDDEYIAFFFGLDQQAFNRIPTFFLQDSWEISDRLRINGGFRWEKQHFGGAGEVAKSTENQWSPRLGVIFQPGNLGTTKIFGSFGRFYVQSPLYTLIERYGFGTREVYDLFYDPGVDPRTDPGGYTTRVDYPQAPNTFDPLSGEHFDEFTLGVERRVGSDIAVSVRGVYRTLGEALAIGINPEFEFVFGNPGSGDLDFLPKYKRDYSALEVSLRNTSSLKLNYSVAYVFSRNQGNYSGFFVSDTGDGTPGNFFSLQHSVQVPNSDGLLPNDRPHSLKVTGSYQADFGLTTGLFFTWQTGTPLNDFAEIPIPFRRIFLVERGSVGRTASIWDLNLRFTYRLSRLLQGKHKARLILDVLHIGSPREVVLVEQLRYFSADFEGNPSNPNSNYGTPIFHQQPMAVRLGMEVDF